MFYLHQFTSNFSQTQLDNFTIFTLFAIQPKYFGDIKVHKKTSSNKTYQMTSIFNYYLLSRYVT